MEPHCDFYQLGKVELQLNDNESIPAFIVDLHEDTAKVSLKFENNTLPDAEYEISNIRLPLKFTEHEIEEMKEGDQIEVLAKIDDVKKWINAKIIFIFNEVFGVEIVNEEIKSKINSSQQNKIKSSDKPVDMLITKKDVRPLNKCLKIIANSFLKRNIKLDEFDLEDFDFNWLNDQNLHQLFKKKVNAITVQYNSNEKCLTVMCYVENQDSVSEIDRRISMFGKIHIKALKNKALAEKSLKNSIEKLNAAKINQELHEIKFEDDLYKLELPVPYKIIGLSRGKQGANLNRAKLVENIKDVEFDDNKSMFVIKASTKEACLEAYGLLSYAEIELSVPCNIVGKLIGKNSTTIQLIKESVGCSKNLRISSNDTRNRSYKTKFIVTGIKDSVNRGVELIRFYMESLYDTDRIRIKKDEIIDELIEIETYNSIKNQNARPNKYYGYVKRYPNYRNRYSNNSRRKPSRSYSNRSTKSTNNKSTSEQNSSKADNQLVSEQSNNSTSKPLNENHVDSSQSNTTENIGVQTTKDKSSQSKDNLSQNYNKFKSNGVSRINEFRRRNPIRSNIRTSNYQRMNNYKHYERPYGIHNMRRPLNQGYIFS